MPLRGLPPFLVLLLAPLGAQDWPMYLRDLAHTSFDGSETQLDKKQITNLQSAWQVSVGANLAAAATVSNGVLYFGDWNGNFHAVNARTGTQLWQTFVGKAPAPPDPDCMPGVGVSSQATLVGNTVYVGGGDSAVYALDKSTGNQTWRLPLADPASGAYLWSSIMPYQGGIYIGVASLGDCPLVRGAVARIDLQRPQQPSIRYLMTQDETGAGVWTTPAIDPATNTMFLNTGNGDVQDVSAGNWSEALVALDASTLAVKASFLLPEEETQGDFDWGSSPTLFSWTQSVPMVAASGKDGVLYALRQADLSLVWKTQLAVGCGDPQSGCGSLSTPAFDGNTLFAGAGVRNPNLSFGGSVYAIRPVDGSFVWVRDTDGTVIAPVTVANGLVVVSTTEGLEIYDSATGQSLWSDGKRGAIFSQAVIVDGTIFSTYVSGDVIAWHLPATGPTTLNNFSAASGLPSLAAGSIATLFGSDLARASVIVEDGVGIIRTAHVLFTSPGQMNYVVPDGTASGRGAVTVTTANGDTLSTALQISDVAPGVFSANGDGKGVAAAHVLVVSGDGSQRLIPVAQCGAEPGSCVSEPIDLGEAADQVFLILYGTGIRGFTSLDNLSCAIGGLAAPVLYAGPQNIFEGLDQVNVQIPRRLAGRGVVDVVLSVDGQLANTVTVSIQ